MNKCLIMKEIKRAEESMESSYKKLNDLEAKLEKKQLSVKQKNSIENELKEVRKLLETNAELLSQLHGQNRHVSSLAVVLFLICLIVYGLYLMFGEDGI